MRHRLILFVVFGWLATSAAGAESTFQQEAFSEDDFAQFFSLIVDGKISKEKMSARCREQAIGFTFAGKDILHESGPERIFYNVSRENASVDGRTLRSKHSNASFGEWTGAVFKPLCPGLYSLIVDFSTKSAGDDEAEEVLVHLYLKRAADERPGRQLVTAIKNEPGPRGSGHATVALPLHSGDEISTWSEARGANQKRLLEHVTFTAYKVVHLESYVEEIDMDAWTRDVVMLKKSNR